jgi:cytochrome b561
MCAMISGSVKPLAYSMLQKMLHWGVALMVMILIPVGFYMVARGEATKFDALTNQLYTAHKTFGFILLWLVALRIVVRLRQGAPAPVASLSRFQVLVSELVHKLLYALLIIVPVLGWAGVSAYPATGILFGLNLPAILPVDQALAGRLLQAHGVLALLMTALVMMHFGAALFHRLILKDGVMARMLGR